MVFFIFIFIFLFRTNGKKEHLDENEFFRKCYYESYWISAMFKGFYQYLGGTLTMTFERHLAVEDFTAMDQHTC